MLFTKICSISRLQQNRNRLNRTRFRYFSYYIAKPRRSVAIARSDILHPFINCIKNGYVFLMTISISPITLFFFKIQNPFVAYLIKQTSIMIIYRKRKKGNNIFNDANFEEIHFRLAEFELYIVP